MVITAVVVSLLGLGFSAANLRQDEIQRGDTLTLRKASVLIYTRPGGADDGEVTRQDLRANGDRIIAQETQEFRSQLWVKVLITSGDQKGLRFKMPDTVGWFRVTDVSKSVSARPYGKPLEWKRGLRQAAGTDSIVEGPVFTIFMKSGFWDSFTEQQQTTMARASINSVWSNQSGTKRVVLKEGSRVLAESNKKGEVILHP
jgi:hypothetical protein